MGIKQSGDSTLADGWFTTFPGFGSAYFHFLGVHVGLKRKSQKAERKEKFFKNSLKNAQWLGR